MSHSGLYAKRHSQALYRLRVEGRLDEIAFDYVDDLTLSVAVSPDARAVSTLTCHLLDQAALVGLVNTLYDFGLIILSVEMLEPIDQNLAG
jgi:hypothetical protein